MTTLLRALLCTLCLGLAACDPEDDPAVADREANLGCKANPLYDDKGVYTGCVVYVDGNECRYDTKGLTELGCKTYCDPPGGTSFGTFGDEGDGEVPDGEVSESPAPAAAAACVAVGVE